MGLGKTLTMIALIVHSIPIERRKFSRCEVDSADSDDDWDLPSKNSRKARATGNVNLRKKYLMGLTN